MKKRTIVSAVICVIIISLMVCAGATAENGSAGDAPDYSKAASWYQIPGIIKDVDTFFIYPTEYMAANEGDPDYAALDNPEMLDGVQFDHLTLASVYEDSTNLFIPYYRQAGMRYADEVGKKTGDPRTAFATKPYADVTAALDYYFEHYNNGRPFIIAGHSQGSGIASLVLMNYFKEHPEYYERMVAAYVIGFSITKDYLEANPHLKFASGESDTGVIISWNTEGPGNVEGNVSNAVVLPNAISINPLNWKLDETYAPASENLGSLVQNEETNKYEIGDIGADAQIVLSRGVILTNADSEPVGGAEVFGPQSFHNGDYTFYYNNIKVNVAKRIAAYLANSSETEKDETETTSRSADLLAEGYELMNGVTVPVGTSNKDLNVEGQEPKNAEKLTIDAGNGKINMYVFRPSNYKEGEKTPVIYFIHGGGYHFGNVSMDEKKIQGVADGSNATVVAPDYTLSLDPSYKYPMELEEVYAGLLYVYEHADELNVDKNNIVIEGESAGGGLTARLALYNRDKGKIPLKGQVLIYPMLDCRTGGKDDIYQNEYAGEFVWTKENNVFGWGKLIESQEKGLTDEEMIYFSPAAAAVDQLKGLPETFMIVGSLDLFCDEDMDYARKLMEAGIFTEFHVEPGVPHAYEYLEWTPQADRFFKLRDAATVRMLGKPDASEISDNVKEYEGIIKYILGL